MSSSESLAPLGGLSAERCALRIAAAGALELEKLPEDLPSRDVARGEHIVRLRSGAWCGRGVARLRYTEISGLPGLYVMNIGLLPSADRGLPMVHAEIVVVGGALRVLILDAHSLGSSWWPAGVASAATELARLRQLAGFELASERPIWAADVISADAVWASSSRPEGVASAAEGADALTSWAASALAAEWPACDESERNRRGAVLHDVRATFLRNEPSRPFLRSVFEPEWAERYMAEFLFPEMECSRGGGSTFSSAASAPVEVQ